MVKFCDAICRCYICRCYIYMCINTTLRKIQVPFQLSCRLMFAGIKNDHVLVGDD